jgi:mRNA interferase RelE/StbE
VSWVLEYDPAVLKDLKRIDRQDQRFILDSLDRFAKNYSKAYASSLLRTGHLKRLQREWKGFSQLRLRSYRAIFRENAGRLVILVVRAGHRRDVYEQGHRRGVHR